MNMICSKDIYPESIPLTTGCIENDKDTFLDLDITLDIVCPVVLGIQQRIAPTYSLRVVKGD